MKHNEYYYKQWFEDRPGENFPNYLEYTGSIYTDGRYITASIPASVSTSATQRLGQEIITSVLEVSRSYEKAGIGGVRVGAVTMYGSLEEEADINIGTFDARRAGKNIEIYKHWAAPVFRPIIRISPEGFMEQESGDKINYYASLNNYGMGLNYKTVDERYNFIPFTDFSQIVPKDLLESGEGLAYPFVYEGTKNLEHYVDPSHPDNDGSIDVFEVRHYMTTLATSDIQLYGFKTNMQGGGVEEVKRGSTQIKNKYEVQKKNNEIYLDSQETIFANFDFPSVGNPGSSGYVKSLPGFVDLKKASLSPFNESYDPIKNSYSFAKDNKDLTSFLSSSRNKISEIGTRFKSSTNGLIFGESNVLGTDSIAFGGLKK